MQQFSEKDIAFMKEAIIEAKKARHIDEVPIGSVIVLGNNIIARGCNLVESNKDSTAHAEIIAIKNASKYLKSKWLNNSTMYVTIEPCSMCAGALVLSRIKRIVFGAKDVKTGACGSVFDIVRCNKLNHNIEVQEGVMAEECGNLISDFFQEKRKVKRAIKNS